MSRLFEVTPLDDGIVSLRIATDAAPYLGPGWTDGFAAAVARLSGDAGVHAVVLEGGERCFQAGASRAALLQAADVGATAGDGAKAVRALLALPVPVIAAAAGHALGGGLILALWCDVIVLAEESLYGANFMALGFTPGMGATHAVPEAFGAPLGRDLLHTGRLLSGREIRAAGCPLSHAVRPRADVREHALRRAREIADTPREASVLLKRQLAARRRVALERAVRAEAAAHEALHAHGTIGAEIARRYPAPLAPESGSP